MRSTTRIAALGLGGLLLAACHHKDKDAPLAFVPADTPYVVANLDVDEAYRWSEENVAPQNKAAPMKPTLAKAGSGASVSWPPAPARNRPHTTNAATGALAEE